MKLITKLFIQRTSAHPEYVLQPSCYVSAMHMQLTALLPDGATVRSGTILI